MASVGDQLRHAREQQKLSIHQVAEATKIKSDHVRALEEGNFNAFAAPVYIRGFARTYAALVRLDVQRVIRDLDAELAQTEEFRDHPSLVERKRGILDVLSLLVSKVNWRVALPVLAVVILLLVAVWAVRAWNDHKAADPLVNLGPGLYQTKPTATGHLLPIPAVAPLVSTSAPPPAVPQQRR